MLVGYCGKMQKRPFSGNVSFHICHIGQFAISILLIIIRNFQAVSVCFAYCFNMYLSSNFGKNPRRISAEK